MINIRIKQLSKRISEPIEEISGNQIYEMRDKILEEINQNKLNNIYEILSQENVLAQIYARAIANIASDDISANTFKQIEMLNKFAILLINQLSHSTLQFPIDPSKCQFSVKDFRKLTDDLRPIPKKRNENLTSLEQIITYLLRSEVTEYQTILSFNSWNDLLSFIFDTDVEDRGKNIGKIEHIHIKEQILANQLSGDIVEEVSIKYDALITFAMSGLTLLSNTGYSDEYSPFLNEILQKLGSSTKIVLIQTRLNANIKKFLKLKGILSNTINLIKKDPQVLKGDYPVNSEMFSKFTFSHEIYKSSDHGPKKPPLLQTIEDLITKYQISLEFGEVSLLWDEYLITYNEFIDIFTGLITFFDDFINDINKIIADLFSSGFRGSIPADDIVRCEKAGIQVRNLIETSSSKRVKIQDETVDTHMKLIRVFEQIGEKFVEILETKAKQESFTSSLDQNEKKFTGFFDIFKKFYTNVRYLPIITGIQESIFMGSRILHSSLQVLKELEILLLPLENVAFNAENSPKFQEILQIIPIYQNKLKEMENVFSIINRVCTFLFQLTREAVVELGKNPKYLIKTDLILKKIENIPTMIKREAQQRYIPNDERDTKLEIYDRLLGEIQKLSEIPISQVYYVLPYSITEINNLFQ